MDIVKNSGAHSKHKSGTEGSYCYDYHDDETPAWAVDHLRQWGMDKHLIDSGLHLQRNANSDTVH